MADHIIREMTAGDVDSIYALGNKFSELLASDKDEFWLG